MINLDIAHRGLKRSGDAHLLTGGPQHRVGQRKGHRIGCGVLLLLQLPCAYRSGFRRHSKPDFHLGLLERSTGELAIDVELDGLGGIIEEPNLSFRRILPCGEATANKCACQPRLQSHATNSLTGLFGLRNHSASLNW